MEVYLLIKYIFKIGEFWYLNVRLQGISFSLCNDLCRRPLFNAAFVSCWTELTEAQQDELILSLEQALTSQEIPEITQTLLNLAEFMEHCDKVSNKEEMRSQLS